MFINEIHCVVKRVMPRMYIGQLFLILFFSVVLYFFHRLLIMSGTKNCDLIYDNYTCCLLDIHKALNWLSLPWFITYGSALMYWRSRNFISNDMDIALFYDDFKVKNMTDEKFVTNLINNFHFKLRHRYGQIDHGQEWGFLCPKSQIPIDIFVFYRLILSNKSSDYWAATYNGLCKKMIYKKCRWKFRKFNLTKFEMDGKQFNIVPIEFIKERYGIDYLIPTKYDYFQSLNILPNLIQEYNYKRRYKRKRFSMNIPLFQFKKNSFSK